MTMFIFVLLSSLLLAVTPALGFDLQVFSDVNCTQPISPFLDANKMFNDVQDWANTSLVPDSVVVTDDPVPCIARTLVDRTSGITLDGWARFGCLDATATEDGQLLVAEYWNTTNCDAGATSKARLLSYGARIPVGTTPGSCFSGNLFTNWINNTYGTMQFFSVGFKVSCPNKPVPNDASSLVDASRMITIMTSIALVITLTDILSN